jgi:hypothetical protein
VTAYATIRLARLPAAARVAASLFAVMMGFGYLSAVSHMYFNYAGVDGKPGVSANDLKLAIHGDRTKSELAAAVNGSMAQYLRDPAEKAKLLAWSEAGAKKDTFASVEPVLKKNCVSCHSSAGPAKFKLLETYEQVAAISKPDQGESTATLARIAHVHVQSLSLVYLALGLLFAFCGFPERLKAFVVAVPLIAMPLDFFTRFLAHENPNMVYGVFIFGALAGLATGAMILGILWETWFQPYRGEKVPLAQPRLQPAGAE